MKNYLIALTGLAFPGLGHLILGKKGRAALFFVVFDPDALTCEFAGLLPDRFAKGRDRFRHVFGNAREPFQFFLGNLAANFRNELILPLLPDRADCFYFLSAGAGQIGADFPECRERWRVRICGERRDRRLHDHICAPGLCRPDAGELRRTRITVR